MANSSVIGFLVVNRNSDLPYLSILSALKNSDSNICIGFIREVDIIGLPSSSRISFVKLDPEAVGIVAQEQKYMDFSTVEFYKIVQLKWQLLEKLIQTKYDYVFYSDFDVIWLKNPILEIIQSFKISDELHVMIQSFTTTPSEIRLCMGFVAFRNSQVSRDFLTAAKNLHSQLFLDNQRIGDDDVVTRIYRDANQPRWMRELPQATFPVGSLLNLFSKKNSFPGLSAPIPYIFHANYVVGLRNKRIIMYLILKRFSQIPISVTYFRFVTLVILKRFKYFIARKKKQLFN